MDKQNTRKAIIPVGNIIITPGDYKNTNAIENTISYIYRLTDKSWKRLPIYCYGIPVFPPDYQSLIDTFYAVRAIHPNPSERMAWHMILSFSCLLQEIVSGIYYYADAIAKLVGQAYPVCYSYHAAEGHPHFHYIISAAPCFTELPCLDETGIQAYMNSISSLSQKQGVRINFIQKGDVGLV